MAFKLKTWNGTTKVLTLLVSKMIPVVAVGVTSKYTIAKLKSLPSACYRKLKAER